MYVYDLLGDLPPDQYSDILQTPIFTAIAVDQSIYIFVGITRSTRKSIINKFKHYNCGEFILCTRISAWAGSTPR